MGRHGTGGSEDGDERGHSAFWGPDEQAEPPGWPSLPDQPEVTGQWAPMPRRTDAPPPRATTSEPFETTGAFALPTNVPGGFPPGNDPAGAYPQQPGRDTGPDEPGPFETTGAFARPPEWNRPDHGPADQTAVFGGGPGQAGAYAQSGDTLSDLSSEQRGLFDPPKDQRGAFDDDQRGSYEERTRTFDGPIDQDGPFEADRREPFGSSAGSSFDDAPDDRTARFDPPSGPSPVYGGPPEPGDVKVAGEPTAAPTPAWASAETSFLGADPGWSDEDDEPRGRRGRRRQGRGGGGDDDALAAAPSGGGKGRVALLSVAAVAVVLGGTVAGVKFMSSSDPAKCEGATCAAVQAPNQRPAPAGSGPAEEETEAEPEDEPLDEEPVETEEPSKSAAPSPTMNAGVPRRTADPSPTPTKTRAKKQEEKPVSEPSPDIEETASEEPSEEVSRLDDAGTADNTGTTPQDQPSPTPSDVSVGVDDGLGFEQPFGNAGALNVKQTIKQRLTTYQANLTLLNESAQPLRSPTVSVPVEGKVVKVDGAQWTQDGDLLILDLSTTLASGDSVEVSFTATGRGAKARNCGMVSGQCAIS